MVSVPAGGARALGRVGFGEGEWAGRVRYGGFGADPYQAGKLRDEPSGG